jgi:predicted RNA-binding Zn-ribbon protein involved in translation (DUF1610 family)
MGELKMNKQDFYTLRVGQKIIKDGKEVVIDCLYDRLRMTIGFKGSQTLHSWNTIHKLCEFKKTELSVTCPKCGKKQIDFAEICNHCRTWL